MTDALHIDGHPYDQLLRMFAADVGTLPALVWRADLVKNEIAFLNDHVIPGLDDGVIRLLQDPTAAEAILAADDLPAFARFQERLRQRQPVSEVFRAHGRDGLMRWIYILGTPDPEMTFCYLGLLADCTGLANGILKRGSEVGLSEHVELFANPVFMIHVGNHQVVAANAAARDFFGIDPGKRQGGLGDLLAGNTDAYLRDIYEQLLFSRSWNGLLSVRAANGENLVCMARVRAYDRDGRNLLWFSLSPRLPAKPAPAPFAVHVDPAVGRALAKAADIRGLLRVLLDNQPGERRADAVMLSQIFIAKGRVAVTGIGKPFETVNDNDAHPYQGSIAENLVLYDLDHIIVDDTAKSIKPIDWALFIPKGIRSYYALPYFADGVLREVLIFCSKTPQAFAGVDLAPYAALAESLWLELPRILGGDAAGNPALAQPD